LRANTKVRARTVARTAPASWPAPSAADDCMARRCSRAVGRGGKRDSATAASKRCGAVNLAESRAPSSLSGVSGQAIPYELIDGALHRHGGRFTHAHPHAGPHDHGPGHAHSHSHGHSHGLIDPSIQRSRAGLTAVGISLAILGATAAIQAVIYVVTGSV